MSNLNVFTILFILTAIALIGVYVLCYNIGRLQNPVHIYNKNQRLIVAPKQKQRLFIVFLCGLILLLFGGGMATNIIHGAKNAGAIEYTKNPIKMLKEPWLNRSYKNLKHNEQLSFNRRMPKPNQKNILIVLYRYDCPNCHTVKKPLLNKLRKEHLLKHTYFVPSRSKFGKQIVNKANVKLVPTLVYVKPDGNYLADGLVVKGLSAAKYHMNKNTIEYYGSLLKQNK